jgi:hypothetical protein
MEKVALVKPKNSNPAWIILLAHLTPTVCGKIGLSGAAAHAIAMEANELVIAKS